MPRNSNRTSNRNRNRNRGVEDELELSPNQVWPARFAYAGVVMMAISLLLFASGVGSIPAIAVLVFGGLLVGIGTWLTCRGEERRPLLRSHHQDVLLAESGRQDRLNSNSLVVTPPVKPEASIGYTLSSSSSPSVELKTSP